MRRRRPKPFPLASALMLAPLAATVITQRLLRPSPAEAIRMVGEKVAAGLEIQAAAVRILSRRVRANRRRLSR